MLTPFTSCAAVVYRHMARAANGGGHFDWRCTQCAKLLGVHRDGRMHLRFTRSHEYFVGFPVIATCRSCGALNQIAQPAV